jgi:hypothetical protein
VTAVELEGSRARGATVKEHPDSDDGDGDDNGDDDGDNGDEKMMHKAIMEIVMHIMKSYPP